MTLPNGIVPSWEFPRVVPYDEDSEETGGTMIVELPDSWNDVVDVIVVGSGGATIAHGVALGYRAGRHVAAQRSRPALADR